LQPPEGVDLPAYTDALFERYSNPAIRHRTWQIAMDGSQKLPQRILSTVAENLRAGRPFAGLALAVAAWMRYVGGVDERGNPIDVRDPLAARLKSLSDGATGADGKVAALLGVAEIFPPALAGREDFHATLAKAYAGLLEKGAARMVEEVGA
ncbi:MAG TPA: mannitol dehydrogenase family protein, partial [Rhizobium sp.]|nr:mannitol dehydrogenase family protein [Rhizobium sp.]